MVSNELVLKNKRNMLEHISNLAEQYCVHFYCVPTLFSAYTFLRVNIVFCLHKQKTGLLGCYSSAPGVAFRVGPGEHIVWVFDTFCVVNRK